MDTILGISWLWWAVGTFGIVGTALLLWLAPALLVQIVSWLLKFFITTRLGNIIAAAGIAFFVGDVNRSIYDQHQYAARAAAFQQAQKQRDDTIKQETRESVLREIGNQQIANSQIDRKVEEFKYALPPTPAANGVNPLRVGDASCRLRDIAGYSGCGPDRSEGVPKAGSEGRGPRTVHRPRFKLPSLITRGSSRAEESQ